MYKDEDHLFPEYWVNVELTSQQYQPTFWIKEHSAIKDSAIIAGTYLTPISDVQTVACQLADLASGYYDKYKCYDEFTLKCAETSLRYYAMNPNAIVTMGKSLNALLKRRLEQNGNHRDAYTDILYYRSLQCMQALKATYWTQETEELRRKWQQNSDELEKLQKNVITIK